jgi:hypothetical protein
VVGPNRMGHATMNAAVVEMGRESLERAMGKKERTHLVLAFSTPLETPCFTADTMYTTPTTTDIVYVSETTPMGGEDS